MARRLRFSIRTLGIFLTLVCAYFGAWEATKIHVNALEAPFDRDVPGGIVTIIEVRSPLPFVVVHDEVDAIGKVPNGRTCYYFWFFGYIAKLPYEKHYGYRVVY